MIRRRMLRGALALAFGTALGVAQAGAQNAAPVKIGVLTDMNGPFADLAGRGSVVAAEMAVRDFGGTVLGRPVNIVSSDYQTKTDVALGIARQWYDTEGVGVIVDMPHSPVALAVQGLATERKRIAITTTAATDLLTNEQCSAYGAHWTYDSYSVSKALASTVAVPGSTWFFIAVDNAGGAALQASLARFLEPAGAKVLGAVKIPPVTRDMSSFLLQAQASGAQYVPIAGAGTDLQTAMKQAQEFGLRRTGQTLVGTAVFDTDLKAMGLQTAQGLEFGTGFTTAQSPEAAEWSKRFFAIHNAMPTAPQAGTYSAVLQYLKAIQAAGTDNADAVMAKLHEMPVNDMFARGGVLRRDGRMVHDMFLVQAKTPAESRDPWDLVKVLKTIPGDQAFRPLAESACPLVKGMK